MPKRLWPIQATLAMTTSKNECEIVLISNAWLVLSGALVGLGLIMTKARDMPQRHELWADPQPDSEFAHRIPRC